MAFQPDPVAERFTMNELRRVLLGAVRMRWLAAAVLVLVGAALAWVEAAPFRGTVALAFGLGLAAFNLIDERWLQRVEFGRGTVLRIAATLVVAQAALIALTGGIRSPFVVLVPPLLVISALGMGLVRLYVIIASAFVTYFWLLAIGEVVPLWSPLLPRMLGGTPGTAGDPAHAITLATLMTLVSLIGGGLGLSVRRAFDRATAAAVHARAETVEAMRARNHELVALSGALAHELKNPLAAIRGLAGVVARRLEPGSREAEQMGVLLGEVGRMSAVLDEFLNFSRPAAGLAARDVDPVTLLEQVARVHEAVALEREVRLVCDASARGPLRADPRKLEQVLANLVQNALDASPRGEEVRLVATDVEGGVAFEVLDRGPGLADEVRGRLFTPGTTTKAAGSGLGLTIARAIAEQHGGRLTLEARPGGGCRALVVLPPAPPAP